jgi:threonine dehydrogenase-like Zn-dependent dehydrogenase
MSSASPGGRAETDVWAWTGPGAIEHGRAPLPVPGAEEVLLHVRAVGVCGTDLHIIDGAIDTMPPPAALGHEIAGEVVATGPDVTSPAVGTRCCVDPLKTCGRCDPCRRGAAQHCVHGAELGVTTSGAWQEHLLVPARNCYEVPSGVSFAEASQAEPVHVVVAAIDRLGVRAGEAALVIGDGPTGLYFARLLHAAGCRPVTLAGATSERLAVARSWGTLDVVDVRAAPLDGERRFPIVVEAVGDGQTIRQAIAMAAPGARVALFGLPTEEVALDLWKVVTTELTLYGGSNAPQVWPRVVRLLSNGTAGAADVISDQVPFERLPDAIARSRAGALKVVLTR